MSNIDYCCINSFIQYQNEKMYNEFMQNYITNIKKAIQLYQPEEYNNFSYTLDVEGIPYSFELSYFAVDKDRKIKRRNKQLFVINYPVYADNNNPQPYKAKIIRIHPMLRKNIAFVNAKDILEIQEPVTFQKFEKFLKDFINNAIKEEYTI